MKAVTIHGPKDLRIDERPEVEPGSDEVRIAFGAGGICGSDMSYWAKGGVGDFMLREPLVLGHEISGTIERIGASVTGIKVGDRVAVDPSRPCLSCDYCREGRSNLCRNMRFFGSAAIFPHVQGAFSESFICRADQCVVVPGEMSFRKAAMAEPLAVSLHAVRRAGELLGKNVLITGSGPIGMLCALAARQAGAATITMTDLIDEPLELARSMGIDETINVATDPERLTRYEAGKGHFDIGLEATGAPQALDGLLKVMRPGSRIVQVGMMPSGQTAMALNVLMSREIDYVGAFRFSAEFRLAVDMLVHDRIDITPLLSAELPASRATEAFELAVDRRRSIKVHLHF